MPNSVVTVSDYTLAFGQSHFLRQVAIPFADRLAEISVQHSPAQEDAEWDPQLEASPRADALAISRMVGVIAFVTGWGAEKALDEIYNVKLGPALRSAIALALTGEPTTKKYALSLLVNKSPERISILVAAVGGSVDEMERSEKQVMSVVAQALQRAQQFALPGQVHLYIAESGECNDHPWIHPDMSSAMEQLRSMSADRPVRYIANGS